MRPRAILAAVAAFLLVGGTVAVSAALAGAASDDAVRVLTNWQADPMTTDHPTPQPAPDRRDRPVEVTVDIDGFLSWAALDRATGQVVASANAAETSSTESMIKAWIVADHLRRATEQGREPSEASQRDARRAIRDSHNGAAQQLYLDGGGDAVVRRLVETCRLVDTHIPVGGSGWWSRTEMSARDAVRMGACIADGTAAGPEWTDWLLGEMRAVRGTTAEADQRAEEGFEGGRWGIIDGLPEPVRAAGVAIKNGWTRIGADASWHLNCLAITDHWVMAVLMRYPAEYPLDYGAQRCASVARQLTQQRFAPTGQAQ